jgi:hypothetical protein
MTVQWAPVDTDTLAIDDLLSVVADALSVYVGLILLAD